ncbi:immunoglobulin-like domain-containing protein [Haloplasma contractile]|uniref:Surface protein responsible for cell interaction contains cell adhesion domain containing p n=1 Tax=Haloplasma contractile SSD-17B TaxID=1033810 RepID=U2FG82_9MOLU|nr:immunoglobulin-like domain-containing protein [Haloplasma contractile]ERJ11895.1 putative surface protein responsible for cell interaction contains cell adhesion domain containing p [Haloplasma contractile SSD-17B]
MKKYLGIISLFVLFVLSGCVDDTKPTITLDEDFKTTYEVNSIEPDWESFVTVSDDEGEATLTVDTSEVDMNKVGTFHVKLTATDLTGNEVTIPVQISMIDTTKPIIQIADTKIVAFEVGSAEPNWLEGVTATDSYDGEIGLTNANVNTTSVDMNLVGTYTITYTVRDLSNNSSTDSITVTIEDTTAPSITGLQDQTYEVGSEEPNWLDGVTATDNYDGPIYLTLDHVDTTNVDMNTVGTYTVTYTVTDANGNTTTETITVAIVDTTYPTITGLQDQIYEVGTPEPNWLDGVTATDNNDESFTLTLDNVDTTNVDMNTVGTFTVSYTVTDANGNTTTESISVTIVDTTNPTITGLQAQTYEVGTTEPNWLDGLTATDNNDESITLTVDNVDTTSVDMNIVGTFTVTYTVTDINGNTTTETITITIVDTTNPIITGLQDQTYEVGSTEPNWLDGVTATDNYDGSFTLTLNNIDTTNVDMNTVGTFTVTYTVTDVNGNTTTETITITIVDTTKPIITGLQDQTYEVGSLEPNWLDDVTAMDNNDGEITLTLDHVDTTNVDMNTVGTYTVTYTVTDINGNTTTETITITIVDTTNPTITGLVDLTYNVGWTEPNWLERATVTDNYDGELTLTLDNVDTSSVDMNTVGTFTVTYTVTDSNNNTTTESITVSIVDVERPIIIGLQDQTYEVGSTEPDWLDGVTATDNYDGEIILTEANVDSTKVDMDSVGKFTVTYTVTDSSNYTTTESITVTIVDTVAPTFIGLQDQTYEVGTTEPDWLVGIAATDNYDGTINLTKVNINTVSVDMNTVGTFTVTYTVTDANENTTIESITVTIIDTIKPTINGLQDQTYEVGTTEPDWLAGVTATDNYDGTINLTDANVDTTNVDMNTVGTFTVTYTVTDANGNTTTEYITITLVDTTKPTITGLQDQSYEVGSIEPNWLSGVTAMDNYDGSMTLTLDNVDTTKVDMNTVGTFTVTYTVTDTNHNTTSQMITITITDTTAPILSGLQDLTFEVGSTEPDWLAGVTANDNYDGTIALTLDNVDRSNVDMNTVGTFTVTYTVTDTNGNTSIDTIAITIEDTQKPVISGLVDQTYDPGAPEPNWLEGIIVTDNYDGTIELTLENVDTTQVDMNTIGTFTVTYTVSDTSGNTTIVAINVTIEDMTPPIITLNGETELYIHLGTSYTEPGATAYDETDGDLTLNIMIEGTVDPNLVGTYTISYTVSDEALNLTTVTRTIHVEDNVLHAVEDAGLKQAILDDMYITEGPVTTEMAESLTSLYAGFYYIRSVEGLQYFTNLTKIDLLYNDISDITPLENLPLLEDINLNNNNFSDLSSLQNIKTLKNLWLENNNITDLSVLANLSNLDSLYLSNNQVSDLTPLINLANLQNVYLSNNQVTTLPENFSNMLNLNGLHLSGNQITDVTPLSTAPALIELDLSNNQITDLTNYDLLTYLFSLNLNDNSISDLTPLANLTKLSSLRLNNNQISDLTPLGGLTNLTHLYAENNAISDLTPLTNLNKIWYLVLNGNQISDLTALSSLTDLSYLRMNNNQITDLSPLQNLRLSDLQLNNNLISDLSYLANSTSISKLLLNNNQISDISVISNFTGLRTLELDDNMISDLSALSSQTNLELLYLRNNLISDVTPLTSLTTLWRLYLDGNNIDLQDPDTISALDEIKLSSPYVTIDIY